MRTITTCEMVSSNTRVVGSFITGLFTWSLTHTCTQAGNAPRMGPYRTNYNSANKALPDDTWLNMDPTSFRGRWCGALASALPTTKPASLTTKRHEKAKKGHRTMLL